MRRNLRAGSYISLFYVCGVFVIACLVGIGLIAQNGRLVYGFETADDNTPHFDQSLKESNPEDAISQAEVKIEPEESESENAAAEVEPLLPPPPGGVVGYDFDNDGKADIGRWNPAASEFRVKNSAAGTYSAYTIGTSAAKAAPGRFDGDTITDAAVFNAGTWTIRRSTNGTTFTIAHGQAGDIPVAGNYETADSITDAAVFRPSTGTWLVKKSSNGQIISQAWGQSGDIPVPGNYDNDSISDYAVFRPSTGVWYIFGTMAGQYTQTWGQNGDVPVPADYS